MEDLDLNVGGRAADAFGDPHPHRRRELGGVGEPFDDLADLVSDGSGSRPFLEHDQHVGDVVRHRVFGELAPTGAPIRRFRSRQVGDRLLELPIGAVDGFEAGVGGQQRLHQHRALVERRQEIGPEADGEIDGGRGEREGRHLNDRAPPQRPREHGTVDALERDHQPRLGKRGPRRQESLGERGHEGDRQHQRDRHRRRHRHRERRVEPAGDAADGEQRDEDREDHQHGGRDGRGDLRGSCGDRGAPRAGAAQLRQPVRDVLDHDHAGVDEQADRDGEPAERHRVEALAERQQRQRGAEDGERQQQQHDRSGAQAAQQHDQHEGDEDATDRERLADAAERVRHQLALVVEERERHARRQRALEVRQHRPHAARDSQRVRVGLLDDAQRHHLEALVARQPHAEAGRLAHFGHVAERHQAVRRVHGQPPRLLGRGGEAGVGDEGELVAHLEDAGAALALASLDGGEDLLEAHRHEAHALGDEVDLQLPFLAAEQLDAGDAGNRLQSRDDDAHRRVAQLHRIDGRALEDELLDLLQAAGGAGEQRGRRSVGELRCHAGDLLGHHQPAAERVGMALEGDDDLHHAGLHGGDDAPDVRKPLQRLLERLRDGELELGGVAPGALDEHLHRRQRQVREEIAPQVEEGEQAGGAEHERERQHDAATREHPLERSLQARSTSRVLSGHGSRPRPTA